MQVVGEMISHVTFGEGVISGRADQTITVSFPFGNKKFLFPDAFEKYLVLKSKKKQEQVEQMVDTLLIERERKEAVWLKKKKYYERIWKLKVNPNSQAAFGFIKNTAEQVFSSWTLSTGTYLSGNSKGLPRIPQRMHLNSACLLTECPKGRPEKEREIIGVCMVSEDFDGRLCTDGLIHSHDKFKIELEEPEKILFWKYFAAGKTGCRWGNAEIQYFSNRTMQRILQDICKKTVSLEKKKLAEEFYQYFMLVNKLLDEGGVASADLK